MGQQAAFLFTAMEQPAGDFADDVGVLVGVRGKTFHMALDD
jgi:hypothetical protein